MDMSKERCDLIKQRLERVVSELLTARIGRNEIEEKLFRETYAWQLERVIDEIDYPREPLGSIPSEERTKARIDEILASRDRILRRIKARENNAWAEIESSFAAHPDPVDAD